MEKWDDVTSGDLELTWIRVEDFRAGVSAVLLHESGMLVCCAPQKPVSRPTEKQLASWLNATDKDTGPAESSITGLVFILATFTSLHVRGTIRSA